MVDEPIDCDFPVWGLLPKKETGVVSFLNKYPKYDGRDTIIAIFDSGVDPAAAGLQVTSTGETKVIERYDCSGCGDVDTSTVIKKVTDGHITGLTGRKLKVPETWKNPTGTYRVGILHPFSLYPSKLRERIQEHRKEHLWDVGHKPAFAAANKQLQDFESEVVSKNPTLSLEDKFMKEELEARVEVLQNAEKKYTDLGPTYDCVLFHDGEVWRACIDTSESGDLASGPLLGEYSATHEHTHLTDLDEMTISINVHDEGQTLEVVGMCSTHGTHVAAIASGYFPDEPDKNGVAPGSKIISLTIGDSRLGSMETGTALIRACIKVMELSKKMKIDVINMSYGEHAHWSNAGRVGETICAVVNRYDVAWVVSAGNHGPALATLGAPPDLAQPVLIGVGAYVSPEMMAAAYSMRERLGGGAFSWSSRGPAPDGGIGLAVCAPGGAVASVARFTLRNSQLMNGTSMAAPHVAGVVAALISGLKDKNLPYSPYSIKRMLENSATYLSHVEPWAQGAGLVNIEKAFDYLTSYHSVPERDVTFSIQCGAANGKGVLLRPRPADPPLDIALTVEPHFLHHHDDVDNKAVIQKQISFGMRLALACAAEWVAAPAHLDLAHAARPIALRVRTARLPPGAHFASVNAYDVNCPERGAVFRVPITVLQPVSPAPHAPFTATDVLFRPAHIARHFLIPPNGATWGVLKMWTSDQEKTGRFLVHTMQLLPRRSCRCHETQKMVNVTGEAPTLLPFQVVDGVTIEVVIAKYWANIGELSVSYTIEFHGLKPDFGSRLVVAAGEGVRAITVGALRLQEVQPVAQLKYSEPVVRPSESKIIPLTARDIIPPTRQIYQLLNTYNFHIAKATEVSPIITMLSEMLYESEFESQMWMLYNSCKQLMGVGDAYPSKYSVKLEKGDYVLRVNVRHENRSLLERLQELPVLVQQRLPQPITLDVYCSHLQALTGGKKFVSASLSNGNVLPLYIAALPADKLARSTLSVGQNLTGTLTLARDELGRRVDARALHYAACEAPRRPPPRDRDRARPADDYSDACKDFATGWLPKLEGEKLEQLYEEMQQKFPGYLGTHIAYLQAVDPPTDPKKLPHANQEPDVTKAWCEQLIAISDKVIKAIDQDKLLAYLGTKNDIRSDANKIKQEQERLRGWAVEAWCRRGAALCRLHQLAPDNPTLAAAAAGNYADLLRFTDLTDPKVRLHQLAPDNPTLAAAAAGNYADLLRFTDLTDPKVRLHQLAPDNPTLAAAAAGNYADLLRFTDLTDPKVRLHQLAPDNPTLAAAAAGNYADLLRFTDLTDPKVRLHQLAPDNPTLAAAAAGNYADLLRFTDLTDPKVRLHQLAPDNPTLAAAAAGNYADLLRFTDLTDPKVRLHQLAPDNPTLAAAAAGNYADLLRFTDLTDPKVRLHQLAPDNPTLAAAAAGNYADLLRFTDLTDPKVRLHQLAPDNPTLAAAAAGNYADLLRFTDLTDPKVRLHQLAPDNPTLAAAAAGNYADLLRFTDLTDPKVRLHQLAPDNPTLAAAAAGNYADLLRFTDLTDPKVRLHQLAPDNPTLAAAAAGNYADLLRFTDLTDPKVLHYGVWHCFTNKHWGRAIKLLNKIQEERPSKEVEERLLEAYEQLGWKYLATATQLSLPIKYPSVYRPF
ncbi:tripeptidyl-peptidase 2 [Achroia grisella]|uniref:tripeptidyl-peptidase 2 n=1 Tax=Achroia grisella TaxID=688607 RepID=UPI0027D23AE3|nr:tripeptidyl-peptidase 2 [Achroia grisella]